MSATYFMNYPAPTHTLSVSNSHCTVSSQGAHVLSWQTADGQEQLYLSPSSAMDGHTAIRGGVPICFPQFNMRVVSPATQPLAKHGFARNMLWQLKPSDAAHADTLRFVLVSSAATRTLWPHEFEAELSITLAPQRLRMTMTVRNTGTQTFPFAVALHSYLRVTDTHQVVLSGLENVPFWDSVAHAQQTHIRSQDSQGLRFGQEMDRVYANAPKQLLLQDLAYSGTASKRSLRITSSESLPDTVVWNPAAALCAKIPDLPDDGWLNMLCVEAACIETPIQLAAGQTWEGWQEICVEC